MKTTILLAAVVALSTAGSYAYAGDDDAEVTGLAGGAVTGAVVGGPVGAVIGGAVGLAAGAAIDPPPKRVVTYVQQQPIPSDTVVLQQPIVVGKPVPSNIIVQPVPDDDTYSYAIVNNQRVIIDPQTNTVVQVLQ